MSGLPFVELHAHSSHSLLDGVSSPAALVQRAAEYGMPALALTDHDALYGAVPFVRAAQTAGIKPILGAEVTLEDTTHLTLLVETREGYANLCQLLTLAHAQQPKGVARLEVKDLAVHTGGLIALSGCALRGVLPQSIAHQRPARVLETARRYAAYFGHGCFYIELQRHYRMGELRLIRSLVSLAERLGLPFVATGNTHYLDPAQREIHDVLTCVRNHTTLPDAGEQLRPNDEYCLRKPEQMALLFRDYPEALANTLRISERCAAAETFLPTSHQQLPYIETPDGSTPESYLRRLCQQALRVRYPASQSHCSEIQPQALLDKELAIIHQLGLDSYFLLVAEIVHASLSRGIRCQGRGSAANSLVAYLLEITAIDPIKTDLVFERFLSLERSSPPDIDIDFAADRREEIIQYIYERYGRRHAAMACTLVTYHARLAVHDVSRALGFPPALVQRLSGALDVHDAQAVHDSHGIVETFGADLAGAPFQHLLRLAPQLEGIPRHLGIHSGGMILSAPPLSMLMPLEPATMLDRTVTQWDKYALEDIGIIKVDLLGLRMLSAIEDAVTIVGSITGQRPNLTALTPDDPSVYDMICRGETIGVFQVESRAQANLIPNFQPHCFSDLAIQIALIRPGPLQAHMVRPYLWRRMGHEQVRYLHPLLQPALEETLGVIVFQEQVLKVARDLAGFTAGEGEQLRRALGHKNATDEVARFETRFVQGAVARGVSEPVARQVFSQLQAFGGYAFPKSHAAAFAVLTYQSAWLRRYHPAAFFAALLRHQPMGFYPPHVIVSEARRRGVEVLRVDAQESEVGAQVQQGSIRLGLEMVKGLGKEVGERIVQAREAGPYRSLQDLCVRTGLGRRVVEALIFSGALDGWNIPRRQMFWDLQVALSAAQSPPGLELDTSDEPTFAALPRQERTWFEYTYTGVTAQEHLTDLVADQLRQMGVTPSDELHRWPDGTQVRVGGNIVARQQPPTAKGTVFLALEDEQGMANIVLPAEIADTNRRMLMFQFIVVEGMIKRDGAALSIVGSRVLPLSVI